MLESWKPATEQEGSVNRVLSAIEKYARIGIVAVTILTPNLDQHDGLEAAEPTSVETLEIKEGQGIALRGLELLPVEEVQKITTLLTQEGYYPVHTVHANVDAVAFFPKAALPLPEAMYTPSGIMDESHTVSYFLPQHTENMKMTAEVVDYLFGHELGHLTDWRANRLLNEQERTQLLYDFTNMIRTLHEQEISAVRQIAYARRDALTHGLPEHNDVSSEQLINDHEEFSEFWAAIAGVYFDDPTALTAISPTLFQFFDAFYKKFDKDFDALSAKEKRAVFIAAGGQENLTK